MSDKSVTQRLNKLEKTVRQLEPLVSQPGQGRQTGVSEKEDSSHEGQEAPRKATVIFESPQNASSPKKTSKHPTPRWKRRIEKVMGLNWWRILEGLGIVAAIAYAILTYLQWSDLRHNFMVDERSWVKLQPAWAQFDPTHGTGLNVSLVNAGKSTITGLYAEGVFEIVNSSDSPSFSLHKRHSTHSEVLLFPGDTSVFPIQLFDQSTKQPRTLTPDELKAMSEGNMYGAVFGWIVYFDQFGKHWYRFCAWNGAVGVPPNSRAKSGDCVAWNRIGDGKPPKELLPEQNESK